MKYIVINDNHASMRYVRSVIRKVYPHGFFDIRHKRGQTQVFFKGKDLTRNQAIKISELLGLRITSLNDVKIIMSYK